MDFVKLEEAQGKGLISEHEVVDIKILELEKVSNELKKNHVWGDWENWRKFINMDIQVNELKIRKLELDNQLYKETLEKFKDY